MRKYIVLGYHKVDKAFVGSASALSGISSHDTTDAAERTIMDIKLGKTDFIPDAPIYLAKLKRY